MIEKVKDWPGPKRCFATWDQDGDDPAYNSYHDELDSSLVGRVVAVYRLVAVKRVKDRPRRFLLTPVVRRRKKAAQRG